MRIVLIRHNLCQKKYINISLEFQKIEIHLDTGLHNDLTETIKVLLGVQLFLVVRYISVCAQEGLRSCRGNFVQEDPLASW